MLITADGRAACGDSPLLLARRLFARSDSVLQIAHALGITARPVRRRFHDSDIYCATTAADMQMPILRVELSLTYAIDRRRPLVSTIDRSEELNVTYITYSVLMRKRRIMAFGGTNCSASRRWQLWCHGSGEAMGNARCQDEPRAVGHGKVKSSSGQAIEIDRSRSCSQRAEECHNGDARALPAIPFRRTRADRARPRSARRCRGSA